MKKIVNDGSILPIRLDHYLVAELKHQTPPVSRSQITNAIKLGTVTVNGKTTKPGHILNLNDEIDVDISDLTYSPITDIQPAPIDFETIYEDDDIIIVNKPNNLVVHPAPGHYKDTLLNGLLYRNMHLSDINGSNRLGIIHRIDKMTTGLLIVAKNNPSHLALAQQLESHTLNRKYLAICHGMIDEDTGTINAPIGRDPKNRLKKTVINLNSKAAVTNFLVIKRSKRYTYVECSLETGRTHQIRVHFNYIKKPILGDHLYGIAEDKSLSFGQYLHAYEIAFIHPTTHKHMKFNAPLPPEFITKLTELDLTE